MDPKGRLGLVSAQQFWGASGVLCQKCVFPYHSRVDQVHTPPRVLYLDVFVDDFSDAFWGWRLAVFRIRFGILVAFEGCQNVVKKQYQNHGPKMKHDARKGVQSYVFIAIAARG